MHPTTLPIMSKILARWRIVPLPVLPSSPKNSPPLKAIACVSDSKALDLCKQRALSFWCGAKRQVRYEYEAEDGDNEYWHNEQITQLELYSQSVRGEALLVHAVVDEDEVDVLIFKGFSSCLSYSTSPDPTRSILPARAVIKSIDRIKGPFDPSNIEYLQKGVTWEEFKNNLLPN